MPPVRKHSQKKQYQFTPPIMGGRKKKGRGVMREEKGLWGLGPKTVWDEKNNLDAGGGGGAHSGGAGNRPLGRTNNPLGILQKKTEHLFEKAPCQEHMCN